MQEKNLSQEESLKLITTMIAKGRGSYNERGWSPIMWGAVVSIASLVTYCKLEFNLKLPFDIWLLVLAAIIPQVIFSIKEKKQRKVSSFEDDAINAAWLIYGLTIFGLTAYQIIATNAAQNEGWSLVNSNNATFYKSPSPVSFYSLYILVYAFPTMITGLVKKFKPMIIGGIICYAMFIVSCYTTNKYDFLVGAVAAIFAWFIPGVILHKKYIAQQKKGNV